VQYGGGAIGALKLDPLDSYLRDHNSGTEYDKAVENFVRSCAGYCVATFVLGIGDRHNDNIMVTKDGHLFHIDFGHFLGNFKKKFGFNRERTPFVFTPEMAYVMGGKKYKKSPMFKRFKELCCRAFNILRKNVLLLENLFLLSVSAGMPELAEADDVHYLRDMLLLDTTDKEAEKRFKVEIKKSLDNTFRRIDNWIHNAKHGH
jgi:phosphatidylinositol-4,5-bisphosphate 3-kinase